MRALFHSNCQALGLVHFMRKSPSCAGWQFDVVQNYQLILKEITPEYERECVEKADLIFYHSVAGKFPVDESLVRYGVPMIPLAVAYNGGYFMRNADPEDWREVLEVDRLKGPEEAANFAVHESDLGYKRRWEENWAKMKRKEVEEDVDESMRISDLIPEGLKVQQFITANHPTSILFYHWANRILDYMGLETLKGLECYCLADMNATNLPCEDFACSAAKRILGLDWGGDERSNRECWHLAKETIERMRNEVRA